MISCKVPLVLRLYDFSMVIFLCDKSGIAARPWAAAGYQCYCVDIQHSIRKDRTEVIGAGSIHFVWGDVRSWVPPPGSIEFIGCFPPCTHLAVSGARDFEKKGGYLLRDSLELFDSCQVACAYSRAPYFIENPVGRLTSSRRKPDYYFDPCDYAGYCENPSLEAYTKKTGLWIGGGFILPPKKEVAPELGSLMRNLSENEERQDLRNATPSGFAQAVFEANCLRNQAAQTIVPLPIHSSGV